jgi:NADPH:quinone reductase-like Zn-dependent oxidoreductase
MRAVVQDRYGPPSVVHIGEVDKPVPADYQVLDIYAKGLIEPGRYRPVVDRRYPLEQAAEAHACVETWQKTGNVVLTVAPE